MEKKVIDPAAIKGWGIDFDLQDEPNYPIKHYTGDDHNRKNWSRPSLQPVNVEILKSTERPVISAVFGSGTPPKALSGALRRTAFKYSESMIRHWLILLMADRFDVIESIFGDIFHGRLPRLIKERGWGAIAKYRPALLVWKILIRLVIFGALAMLIFYLARRNRSY
jgi:hypothetical protein